MKQTKIVIGTRGSKLSLIQTTIIQNLLQSLLPNAVIEIITIKTSGDKNMSPIPLDTIGKGWFTKEIDKQLLDEKIDIAVHSLKDLLDTLTPGLAITAIPQREDAREALVSRNNLPLQKMKKGAIIGTDSVRRKMQILKIRKDLVIKSVRGNVNKRLEKLDAGEYDALCLAVAGLNRLGLQNRIAQYFSAKDFIPSPGQGALAVVTRANDKLLNKTLSKLTHKLSLTTITAEREFSKATGGGCSMPVGAYAESKQKKLTLYGMLGSEDEKHMIKDSLSGDIHDPKGLARKLADNMLKKASSWQVAKKVVLTREASENKDFAKQLDVLGFSSFSFPGIKVTKNLSSYQIKKYFTKITSYDVILFTSSNGVKYFVQGLKDTGEKLSILRKISIAAVGSKTAETAQAFGLRVSLMPLKFTSAELVKKLKKIKGATILLPRSSIGNKILVTQLEKKGATVIDMPIYKTKLFGKPSKTFGKLLDNNQVRCLMFTSPSTIEGFLNSFTNNVPQKVFSLSVVSIGTVTTKAAKKYGFTNIHTAKIHTVKGMLAKLKESNL